MATRNERCPYFRRAALLTVFLYTAGYAAIGFGFLFFGALWRLISRRTILWRRSAVDVPLAAFGAVLVLSAAASPYHRVALTVTLMLLISGAIYFGTFAWLLDRDRIPRANLLRAWALGAAAAAVAGLVYSATTYVKIWPPGTLAHARAEIPRGVGPNGLGTTLLLGSIVSLGMAFRARGWERAGWAACGLLTLLGLVATGSRASLAGWILGIGYLVYRELRPRPWLMAAVVAAGAIVLMLFSVATPQFMARLRNTVSDVSGNRIRIWRTSLVMIRAHPLLGTGFGTFERDYERHKDPGMSSEPFAFSLPLNLAAETGLVGLLAAGAVAGAAVHTWRSQSSNGAPFVDSFRPLVAALWIGLLVDQLADNTLFSISTSAALWILLALVVVPGTSHDRRSGEAQT